jgi:hypothetical protein
MHKDSQTKTSAEVDNSTIFRGVQEILLSPQPQSSACRAPPQDETTTVLNRTLKSKSFENRIQKTIVIAAVQRLHTVTRLSEQNNHVFLSTRT